MCIECEWFESDFDELSGNTTDSCNKGRDGLKGFPFVTIAKCFKQNEQLLREADPHYWDGFNKE